MFIKVTSAGGHRYARLVESFRNEQGQPRQRTICTLGRLDPGGDVDRFIDSLRRAQGRIDANSSSFEGMQFAQALSAGDVWVVWQIWQSLGLDDLRGAWRSSRSQLDVLACLRAMVFNRLCAPDSKLGTLRWLETVALPKGFGFADALPSHQNLLRAMDVIQAHQQALRELMSLQLRPLLDQELSLVFYDLTTVEVCGHTKLNADVRAHGMSKRGLVQRQFMLSLVQTADGLPIDHEVHPGNTAEASTLLPMIRSVLKRYPLKRIVLVADRGLLSLSNLQELTKLQDTLQDEGVEAQLQYILAVPAARYGEFAQSLQVMTQGHDAQKPWTDEISWQSRRLIVAHDPEVALRRTQARQRRIDELVQLGQQWGGQLDAQDGGAKRRGRPLSDSGAKARMYHAVKDAQLAHVIKVDLQQQAFSFSIDEARQRYLELLDGKLLLVTNTDAPPDQLVAHYKSLADIERGFKVLKSDIEIGPLYHRLPQRIRAHAMVCFIALVIYRVMRLRLKAAKRSESPTTLLDRLRRTTLQTARMPDGQSITGISDITAEQKDLLASIKIPVPTTSQLQTQRL